MEGNSWLPPTMAHIWLVRSPRLEKISHYQSYPSFECAVSCISTLLPSAESPGTWLRTMLVSGPAGDTGSEWIVKHILNLRVQSYLKKCAQIINIEKAELCVKNWNYYIIWIACSELRIGVGLRLGMNIVWSKLLRRHLGKFRILNFILSFVFSSLLSHGLLVRSVDLHAIQSGQIHHK